MSNQKLGVCFTLYFPVKPVFPITRVQPEWWIICFGAVGKDRNHSYLKSGSYNFIISKLATVVQSLRLKIKAPGSMKMH